MGLTVALDRRKYSEHSKRKKYREMEKRLRGMEYRVISFNIHLIEIIFSMC